MVINKSDSRISSVNKRMHRSYIYISIGLFLSYLRYRLFDKLQVVTGIDPIFEVVIVLFLGIPATIGAMSIYNYLFFNRIEGKPITWHLNMVFGLRHMKILLYPIALVFISELIIRYWELL